MSEVSPLRKKFAKNLLNIRKRSRLSQEELGFLAKLHRTYIGSVERAEQNISIDNIHKLIKALKIEASELFS